MAKKNPTPTPAPAAKTPEQEAADKAAIAKAKAEQKAKDEAAKAEQKAAIAKAKAEQKAAKEAEAAQKAAQKAKESEQREAARQEAQAAIAAQEKVVAEAQAALDHAKAGLRELRAKAGFSAGTGASTDALRAKAGTYVHDKERKTANGNVSVDNGDELAQRLRGLSLDEVYAEAAQILAEDESALRAKYAHLNPGMQRMNLGNRMRAK